ncbi:unnamed protein product [Rhizophagus irregularis]|nr:unnamed protein product [Rhizophagus irregularis]
MVQFATEDPIAQFDDTWAILCLGNSLRVCPARYSKTQRDARRQNIAVLAGIPKNIKEADLTDIANQVSAKAINIPLSFTSYKPKPYLVPNVDVPQIISQRSSSRSRSRSHNTRPNSYKTGPNVGTQQSVSCTSASSSSSKPVQPRNQQNQPVGRPNVTLPVQQTGPTITPEEVAALR